MKKFDYDIYLSFSNQDNQVNDKLKKSWIVNTERFLGYLLTQIMGEKPRILFYQNGEKPSTTTLENVAVMVAIISPYYINDSGCVEDVVEFKKIVTQQNLIESGRKDRLFKAIKLPVIEELIPSDLHGLLKYELFYYDNITNQIEEFSDFFGKEAIQSYWINLVDLANDISNLLIGIKRLAGEKEVKSKNFKEDYVYLASTSMDIALQRNILKKELENHGFNVLPDHDLPTNPREMELSVKKDLERCRMSVHLLGEDYGDILTNDTRSIIEIENKLASDHSNLVSITQEVLGKDVFSRVIWVAPYAKLNDERQRIFVENIKRDSESLSGAEVIQTPFEDLKSIIWNELIHTQTNNGFLIKKIKKNPGQKSIYVIFDRSDAVVVESLVEKISMNGFQVLLTHFEGNILEQRSDHISKLVQSDAAIVFAENANIQWLKMKLLDLLKAPGLGRANPFLTKILLSGSNEKLELSTNETIGLNIVEKKNYGYENEITQFLDKIK